MKKILSIIVLVFLVQQGFSQEKDTDGDGVPDRHDRCPTTPGLKKFKGCPDTDGDNIPNIDDACPLKPGPASNKGCPSSKKTYSSKTINSGNINETEVKKTANAQNIDLNNIEEVEEEEEIIEDVPFSIIEEVPVYPGCELLTKEQKKNCLNKKIRKHVGRHFNADLADCLRKVKVYNSEIDAYEYKCEEALPVGKQRIYVQFKIDKDGSITNISARASHPRLEEEGIRVVKKLPKMQPGKQRGKPVRVGYTLPIVFNVD